MSARHVIVDDGLLIPAVHDAVHPVVVAARAHGPLPRLRSEEFIDAPPLVRRAVLLVLGEAWVVGVRMLDEWVAEDYSGGRFHRANLLPAMSELQRRRGGR